MIYKQIIGHLSLTYLDTVTGKEQFVLILAVCV